jgi:hypothetical protein
MDASKHFATVLQPTEDQPIQDDRLPGAPSSVYLAPLQQVIRGQASGNIDAPGPRRPSRFLDAAAHATANANVRSPTAQSAPFHIHHHSSSPTTSHIPPSISAPSTLATSTRPPPPLNHPFSSNALHPSNSASSLSSSALSGHDSGLPPLAPPPGALGSIMASPGAKSSTNGAAAPSSASPLQPPHTSAQLSSDYPLPPREKTSGSFYDPLTDTTKERRPSDSWSSTKPVRRTLFTRCDFHRVLHRRHAALQFELDARLLAIREPCRSTAASRASSPAIGTLVSRGLLGWPQPPEFILRSVPRLCGTKVFPGLTKPKTHRLFLFPFWCR